MTKHLTCGKDGCKREARMAIRTRRPQRDNVYLTVWTDERVAGVPMAADRRCKEHGLDLIEGLLDMLVDLDEEPT